LLFKITFVLVLFKKLLQNGLLAIISEFPKLRLK